MFSRVSVSMKAAGLVMVGCLALGVLLGLIVPKEQLAQTPENMLRGTVDRRLVVSAAFLFFLLWFSMSSALIGTVSYSSGCRHRLVLCLLAVVSLRLVRFM